MEIFQNIFFTEYQRGQLILNSTNKANMCSKLLLQKYVNLRMEAFDIIRRSFKLPTSSL